MDVIGAGFGRTGTLSLKAALEQLGIGPCAHMIPLIEDQDQAQKWLDAAGGVPGALDAATEGHRSTVDWPGVYFWRELVERHPDAKVVLSVRDSGAWYDSTCRTIYPAAMKALDMPVVPPFARMAHATVWDGTFKGRFAERDFAIRVFEEHNEAVRREVPAERLLEFEVKQGWAPLCDFLGVPVPDTEFPRLNDTATFQARLSGVMDR
ncbi:sulfotransferase family protein [Actinoplanes sp. NBRC 103695]|uniref:sulfotransferase family protein n=1 Tax=Actinoplanes sp. NBRC 103695 TaxID=3032202 RepID=UPI0024A5F2B5|nr:sulfotransferase family protein [Actinoplanes sp. NBRC 103695]GLY96092.1 sulfotransferase family protein [Actinoplanes sp. NBRC 103695]